MTLPRTSARTCLIVLTFFVWMVSEPKTVPAQPAGTARPGVLPGQAGCSLLCQDVTVSAPSGQCSEVVNYSLPTPSGQCSGVIQCTPPPAGTFAVGSTPVSCAEITGSAGFGGSFGSGNLAVPIPASGTGPSAMTPQTISIVGNATVVAIGLGIRATHAADADLEVTLTAPNGTTSVLLMDDNGGTGADLGSGATDCSGTRTTFSDSAATSISAGTAPFAGIFKPLNPLSSFLGVTGGGTWTLSIVDDAAGNSGVLHCWVLSLQMFTQLTGATCGFNVMVKDTEPPVPVCPADISMILPYGQTASPVNFSASATDNCPGEALSCVPPSGSPFGLGTTTVNCSATDASGNSGVCDFDVALAAQSVLEVPTASPLGLALFALMVGAVALLMLRRP
jgi:subtilisin-like proprotein convertase family protein